MAGESPPPLPPIPPSAQSAAPPSLPSTSPTMAKLTPSLEQQIGVEVPTAGDVLGDPQLQVGGEPKMSSENHGKLPKKIRKKKSIDACGELQRASDVRDSNEVPTSLPLSKKSAKKVTIKNSDKSPTAGIKRPLSEASGSSRAKKAAKLINAKVEMTQLQNKSKPVRKVAPIVSRSPMINRLARQRAQSHGSPISHAMSPTVAATLKLPSLHDLSPTATNGTAAFMHDLSPTATNGTPASMHDPSPTPTNGSKRRPRKLTSKIWKDAEPIYVGGLLMQGRCKYCDNVFPASKVSGTSQLGRHLKVCEVKDSMDGVIKQIKTSDEIDPDWKFDQEAARIELVNLVVLHVLPFTFVEYAGFRKFCASLNPWFKSVNRFHPCTPDFNILKWWDVNSERYPILGNMARDVLAVPASTVASESAFSACGRVITDHRSSLAPETVEALMCYGDWIRSCKPTNAGQENRCEEQSVVDHLVSGT